MSWILTDDDVLVNAHHASSIVVRRKFKDNHLVEGQEQLYMQYRGLPHGGAVLANGTPEVMGDLFFKVGTLIGKGVGLINITELLESFT